MASIKPASRPTTRPVARLDASLLLARKGEAMPAIAATQHNNPDLAWGAQPHPQDFQSQHHQPQHHQPQPVAQPAPRPQTVATARLRTETFVGARPFKTNARPGPQSHVDDVALTLRIEDETYLRLKYLAQKTGLSTRKILNEALTFHLVRKGVPRSRKMVLKPE